MNNEKRKIFETVANLKIKVNSTTLNEDFVKLVIQSTGGGVEVGRKLYLYDHRSNTIEAAKGLDLLNVPWEDFYTAEWKAKDALVQAVRQPAKVVVMEKVDGDKTFHYVNLYPPNSEAVGLLSMTSYTGKHNAGYEIEKDESHWSWKSESYSRSGRHKELVLVALTDDNHRVVVNSYGHANIGHSEENMKVIGEKILNYDSRNLL